MGKYKYETRPDLSNDQKEYIKTSSDLTIKCWIANELAEANRIARLRLKYYLMKNGTDTEKSFIVTMLEDQA